MAQGTLQGFCDTFLVWFNCYPLLISFISIRSPHPCNASCRHPCLHLRGTKCSRYSLFVPLRPNHNTRGPSYIGSPAYIYEGRSLIYNHVTARPFSGNFRYYINGCVSACRAGSTVAGNTMTLINDSTEPYGQQINRQCSKMGNS